MTNRCRRRTSGIDWIYISRWQEWLSIDSNQWHCGCFRKRRKLGAQQTEIEINSSSFSARLINFGRAFFFVAAVYDRRDHSALTERRYNDKPVDVIFPQSIRTARVVRR
jgi:hypothetical protein